jgi:hypothetical protein
MADFNIDDWVIYILGGMFVIGLPSDREVKPCYQLVRAPSPTGVNMAVVPLCFLHEFDSIPLPPPGTPSKAVRDICRHEKAGIKEAVQKCNGMMMKMRLEASGLAMPPGYGPEKQEEKT